MLLLSIQQELLSEELVEEQSKLEELSTQLNTLQHDIVAKEKHIEGLEKQVIKNHGNICMCVGKLI